MISLHCGDCLEILPTLRGIDAVVADPPYGIALKTDNRRFSGGKRGVPRGNVFRPITGDDRPFDPTPLLRFPKVILWGANFYGGRLPSGGALVWCKKPATKLGKFCGDAEIAWIKGGGGVHLFHYIWDGFNRESERGKTLHPTQKPVELMRWCIRRLKLRPGSTILDPYMGSGPVGIAAIAEGHHFVGCEIDPEYFAIARNRIEAAQASPVSA